MTQRVPTHPSFERIFAKSRAGPQFNREAHLIMAAINRLTESLENIVADLACLASELSIKYLNNRGGNVVIIAPDHYWGDRTAEQKQRHLLIVRRYEQIREILSAWLFDAPKDLARTFKNGDKNFRTWLEFESNWSVSYDKEKNIRLLKESADDLRQIISVLAAGIRDQIILVPDTNSLLAQPDPTTYRHVVGSDKFEFLLLPTVLHELDELKILHRNPEIREKAQKVITRIKGWRTQGSLSIGVFVDRTIRIRAEHREPNVEKSLSWLDPTNADDRIVASVLHVQASNPTARIVLVTGDINLQNKADAAFIEIGEV